MNISLYGRGKWSPALFAVLLFFVTLSARADDLQYLPDGTDTIQSINVAAALKSKTVEELKSVFMKSREFQEMQKAYAATGKELTLETIMNTASLVPVASLARITMGANGDNLRMDVAKSQMYTLTTAAQAYYLKNMEWPSTLGDLLKKDALGSGPYLENKESLNDPWLKPYKYDPTGQKNDGKKPDIWTETPDKVVIGNWQTGKLETGAGVTVYTTIKPIKPADIKAARQSATGVSYVYTETKIGVHTLYEEYIEVNLSGGNAPNGKAGDKKVSTGVAFCIAEEKYVLSGQTRDLRTVLERKKKAELAPSLQTAVKQIDSASTISMAVSLKTMPGGEKQRMLKDLGMVVPGAEAAFETAQAFTVQANEVGGSIKVSALLFCKDPAGAAEAKKTVDAGLAATKGKLDDLINAMPNTVKGDEVQMMKDARALLDNVKVSTKDAQVAAEVSIPPAVAVRVLWAWGTVTSRPEPAALPDEKKNTNAKPDVPDK